MILMICRQCGAWSDITLADAWAKALHPLSRAFAKGLAEFYGLKIEEPPIEEPAGWPCPVNREHGLMQAVTSEDRLTIRPAMVEAEQGESAPEPGESEKRQQIIAEISQLAGRRLGLIGMNDIKMASTERLEAFLVTLKKEARYL